VDGISWRFALLMTITIMRNDLFYYEHYRAAFIVSWLLTIIVSDICYVIKKYHRPRRPAHYLFVHLPFSFYRGWSFVLIAVAAFSAFTYGVYASARLGRKILTFLTLLVLEGISVACTISSAKSDLAGSVAITWAFFAIFEHQKMPFDHWSALAFAIISLLFVVVKLLLGLFRILFRTGNIGHPTIDEERSLSPG